jgi:transcriptional regulator with XRE-family HTH domain
MQHLRELRERAGLTITQAARVSGVAWVTIDRWEKGKHAPHSLTLDAYERMLAEVARRRLKGDPDLESIIISALKDAVKGERHGAQNHDQREAVQDRSEGLGREVDSPVR